MKIYYPDYQNCNAGVTSSVFAYYGVETRINKIPIIYAKYSFEQKLYHMKTGELLAVSQTQNVAIDRERNAVLRLEEDERYSKMEKSIREDIEI